MRVRHLKTWRGSPTGTHVELFEAGTETDLPPRLYHSAIAEGRVEPVEGKARPTPENRAVPPPEVKHVGGGWYELPSGERVRGRKAALERL